MKSLADAMSEGGLRGKLQDVDEKDCPEEHVVLSHQPLLLLLLLRAIMLYWKVR